MMAIVELNGSLQNSYCELAVLKKKKVWKRAKIFLLPGQAKVAPPVSSILGQFGINLIAFCEKFNSASKNLDPDIPVSVFVVVFSDKTFRLKIKPISLNELYFSCSDGEPVSIFSEEDFFSYIEKKNSFLVSFYKFYLCSAYQAGFDCSLPNNESRLHLKLLVSYLRSYCKK